MKKHSEKLCVQNLNFYYHTFHALKNISLPIYKNKITTFIGSSGSGKSTLLRTFNKIYDLYNHTASGSILLDGVDILNNYNTLLLRQKIGMVFQKPTPFPLSIYENVAFGIKLFEKLSKEEMDERVESALKSAALWHELKNKLKASSFDLSQGQQQRLCIARTIATKPDVILFDEPTSSLDVKSTALIEDLIMSMTKKHTVVLVTHSLRQTEKVSDFTAVIKQGTLAHFGPTQDVLSMENCEEFYT